MGDRILYVEFFTADKEKYRRKFFAKEKKKINTFVNKGIYHLGELTVFHYHCQIPETEKEKRQVQNRCGLILQKEHIEKDMIIWKFPKENSWNFGRPEALLYRYVLSTMDKEAWKYVCFRFPLSHFFYLEEMLFFLKDDLVPYMGDVKELYLDEKEEEIPPVLWEFLEYLMLEYGVVVQIGKPDDKKVTCIDLTSVTSCLDSNMKNSYNSLAVKQEKH